MVWEKLSAHVWVCCPHGLTRWHLISPAASTGAHGRCSKHPSFVGHCSVGMQYPLSGGRRRTWGGLGLPPPQSQSLSLGCGWVSVICACVCMLYFELKNVGAVKELENGIPMPFIWKRINRFPGWLCGIHNPRSSTREVYPRSLCTVCRGAVLR